MADYTRVTNFTTKDALPTGDAEKVVSGQELQVELDAIAVAIATKSEGGGGGSGTVGVGSTPVSVAADFTSDATSPFVSLVIPANSIGAYGLLEIDSFFVLTGPVSSPTPVSLLLTLGTLELQIPDIETQSGGAMTGQVHIHCTVQNLGATNAQVFSAQVTYTGFDPASGGFSGTLTGGAVDADYSSPGGLDTTANQTFSISELAASTAVVTHRATIARVTS